MTLNGAIAELVILCEHPMMPAVFKPSIQKIIETVSECEEPSAQPERAKGKWIHDGYDFPHGNDWIHCSICGKKGINVPADLTNFCPNCGADMRGELNG